MILIVIDNFDSYFNKFLKIDFITAMNNTKKVKIS